MTEQLTPITPGSKASSSVINDNFTYLEDLITQLRTDVTGISSSLNNKVSIDDFNNRVGEQGSLTKSVNTAATTANSALEKANAANNRVSMNFNGGAVGGSKITIGTKIRIENWGHITTSSDTYKEVEFTYPFTSKDSYRVACVIEDNKDNDWCPSVYKVSNKKIRIYTNGHKVDYIAVGS